MILKFHKSALLGQLKVIYEKYVNLNKCMPDLQFRSIFNCFSNTPISYISYVFIRNLLRHKIDKSYPYKLLFSKYLKWRIKVISSMPVSCHSTLLFYIEFKSVIILIPNYLEELGETLHTHGFLEKTRVVYIMNSSVV